MFSFNAVLRRAPRVLALVALQGLFWLVITAAFALLIQLAGWRGKDAFYFSATNWLPWAAIAPAVFWLARRFPFERGHFLRSVPIHLLASAGCIVLLAWISATFSPLRRMPMPSRSATEGDATQSRRRPPVERPPENAAAATPPSAPSASTGAADKPAVSEERPRSERRERRGPPRIASDRGERKEGGRTSSGERTSRPPSPFPRPARDSFWGIVFRWGFLGSFWPPFSSMLLRANFAIAVYAIIACVAHAVGYYRQAQERQRHALTLASGLNQAKLDALRLQLQPHFLFNTLNAVSALVHTNPQAADELITDLSELLRLSLESVENEVPLSRELELLDCYLSIERTRLGERLRIEEKIGPGVIGALVPTFILQPLVENAIRHGIEPRRGPGTLTVSACRNGDELQLLVRDDGVGMKPSDTTTRRGIGLANAEARLQALHGSKARLTIVPAARGGVEVHVVLPLRVAAQAALTPGSA